MKARTGGRTIEVPEALVRAEGRFVNEQAHVSLGTLAAPAPYTIVLQGQLKSGKNRVLITRSGQRYPPKAFKAWRDDMLAQIGIVSRPFPGSVHIIVDYVPGDRIRRDAPGMLDALCHVMEKAGIVTDDAQVKSIVWREFPVQPKRPRCSVSIRAYHLDKDR